MILNFTIDTDDIYENEFSFETLFTDALVNIVSKDVKNRVKIDEFKQFATLVSNTIVADIKLRMENFLAEEIVLTARYGEKQFVGSVEDLIKKRFDDVLLRPVDSSGKTLQGCTTVEQTWIEWKIKNSLGDSLERKIKDAVNNLQRFIQNTVDEKIISIKDEAIKNKVDKAFTDILKTKTQID